MAANHSIVKGKDSPHTPAMLGKVQPYRRCIYSIPAGIPVYLDENPDHEKGELSIMTDEEPFLCSLKRLG